MITFFWSKDCIISADQESSDIILWECILSMYWFSVLFFKLISSLIFYADTDEEEADDIDNKDKEKERSSSSNSNSQRRKDAHKESPLDMSGDLHPMSPTLSPSKILDFSELDTKRGIYL